jgi:histidine kinase
MMREPGDGGGARKRTSASFGVKEAFSVQLRSPAAALSKARLRTRLIVTIGAVLLINIATFILTVRVLTPIGPSAPASIQTPQQMEQFRADLDGGLVGAQVSAVAMSLLTGAVAAVLISRVIVRPIEQMRTAARQMTRGRYDTRVPEPGTPELAGIAEDLNTLAGRLGETERRRTRLVSDLAHELRTPLTILRGQLDGVIDGLYRPEPELFGSMSEELERLRRLADELSHLSRAEENAFRLEAREIDLTVLVRDLAERLRPDFDRHGISLTVSGPHLYAIVDPDRISQILVNLLTNALAASDPGGRVAVSLDRTDEQAVLRVADTGCGIAPDDLELIFERFERRTAPGRAAPHQGSGIGLTIARSLAQAHGGSLTAHSAGLGHGAVFTLALPTASTPE